MTDVRAGDPERPHVRDGVTIHFSIYGEPAPIDGYATFSHYPDGRPMELFLIISKQGSTMRGLTDSMAILASTAFQRGDLDGVVRALIGTRYEPYGHTDDPDVPMCYSLGDYLARKMAIMFGHEHLLHELGIEKGKPPLKYAY